MAVSRGASSLEVGRPNLISRLFVVLFGLGTAVWEHGNTASNERRSERRQQYFAAEKGKNPVMTFLPRDQPLMISPG